MICDVEARFLQPDRFANQRVQAARDAERVFFRCLRKQDDEFVSAVAKREIDHAALFFDGLADFGEKLRAHQVAVCVVHILEVIEIDEDERKLEGVAVRAVDLGIEHEIQMARVVEAGAIVGDRQFVDALDVARVFDGDGGVIGERFEQREVALAETFRADAIDQLDDAEALVAEAHGHGDDRTRFHFRLLVHLREETRIFRRVRDDDDFAGLRDPAGKSLTQFDAHVFQSFRAFARGDLEIELALSMSISRSDQVSGRSTSLIFSMMVRRT